MTQYQSNAAPQTLPIKPTAQDPQVSSLKEQLASQQKEIDTLKRTVRKLQNEVRLAVNTFNLTNRG
jgi:uncharacterized coiled-coil protein SlyX